MSTRRRRRPRLLVIGAILALALVMAVVALVLTDEPPAPAVAEATSRVEVRPEADAAPVELDVSVFTPAADAPGADADGRRPAVLLAHGFGGDKDDLADQARRVAGEGYVAVTWTARGFGDSGGLIHLSAPAWEIADVSVLLDDLAARDDVRLDGDGDPVVGIAGASYGGGAALLAAAYDDRVDAVVPAVTWNDLGQALFPQGARPTGDADPPGGVFKQRWASLLYAAGLGRPGTGGAPALGSGAADPVCGRFAPDVCRLYQRAAAGGGIDAAGERLLARSSYPAGGVTAPTLLIQGARDSLFGLEQSVATARDLSGRGTEVAVRWFEGGHDAQLGEGVIDDDELIDPALAWFDHHLRDGPDPGFDLDLTLPAPPLSGEGPDERTGSVTEAFDEPPATDLELVGSPQPVLSPPGGQPAALTSLPGTGAALDVAGGLGGSFALAALPGATAVFETAPVTEDLTVVGGPRVTLDIDSTADDATLFASLWVVGDDDTATLPRQLVSPFRVTGGGGTVGVALPASTYRVEPGQRLRLVVASTDQAYAVPTDGRVYGVALADGGTLTLPTPATEPSGDAAALVSPLLLGGVGLLLGLALLAGTLAAVRGRRRTAPDAASADVPLVVEGLVKEYAGGFRAVDGVSWRAERGQVVGLLGPNGAGKTTTMRMLVGLIGADAGTVRVMGEPVRAGSPVLARVGALIEGPGALPHLTGRDNLHAYWAATGRPAGDAGIEEALAVADLGVAAHKPVRSYSQGMRQRLGIAQAMLGSPELLLLDEPTNGLDPPQIRAMRDVLGRYAATGRTVVVSSHLLGEVEQTCSHVVVMHRGRVVLTGAVADLVEDAGTTLVTLTDRDDPAAAAGLLRDTDGVAGVEVLDGGRLRVDGTARREAVVARLVEAGVGVSGVDGRRHLEEVFMGLVGDGEPAQVAQVAQTDRTDAEVGS